MGPTTKQDPLSPLSPIHHLNAGSASGSSGGSADEHFPDTIKSKSIFTENSPQNAQGIQPEVHYERSPEPFMEKQSDNPLESDVIREHPKDPSTINMENMVDILASTKISGIDDDEDPQLGVAPNTTTNHNAHSGGKSAVNSPFEISNGLNGADSNTGDRSSVLTQSLVSANGTMPVDADRSRTSTQRGGIGSTSYMSGYTASSSTSSMDTPVPASMRNMPIDFSGDSMYSDVHSSTAKMGRNTGSASNVSSVQPYRSIPLNKTGSVVHSQAFLRADYEDPGYGLMNDGDRRKRATGTNCQCLQSCVVL